MANLKLIAQRKRELCGSPKEIDRFDIEGYMSTVNQLISESKPFTDKDILLRQMRNNLSSLPIEFQPFGKAIMEIYKQSGEDFVKME